MSSFIAKTIDTHNAINFQVKPQWLTSFQQAGAKVWQAQENLPDRKTENWKYTSLRALETLGSSKTHTSALKNTDVSAFVKKHKIADLNALIIPIVNGNIDTVAIDNANKSLPEGAKLTLFSQSQENKQATIIEKHLGVLANNKEHFFASLNESLMADGIFLHIEKNVEIKQSIHFLYIHSNESAENLHERLLVVAQENTKANIVEHFVSSVENIDAAAQSFSNQCAEIFLGENANVTHYRLHQENEQAIHLGGVYVELKRNANLNSFHLALGSELKRIDIVVHHKGEGAHCELNGIYLPSNNHHIDYHTCIEHAEPRCTTNENFRGILSDSGRAVFNGRIHIHKDAQKTFAQLSNKNLLTSNKAEIDTKPELEIYADDVQCAHGATVAQLDIQSLHYLQARGIGEAKARTMLSFGFINELINTVADEPVADYLRPILANLFAKDPLLLG